MKLNVGSYLTNGLDYDTNSFVYDKYISLSAVQLLGPIEVNAGMAYTQYTLAAGFEPMPTIDYNQTKTRLEFYGSFGLRFDNKGFLLRGGVGNLELIYIGMGINF